METDPGYDMGANHTYRYVKTSGLGIVPIKWCGDSLPGYLIDTRDAPMKLTSGWYWFKVAWINSTHYMIISNQRVYTYDSLKSIIGDKVIHQDARAAEYTVKFEGTYSIGGVDKIIEHCTIPTAYEASYGPMQDFFTDNRDDYRDGWRHWNCVMAKDKYDTGTISGDTYWLWNMTSNNAALYGGNQIGSISTNNKYYVYPFVRVPI